MAVVSEKILDFPPELAQTTFVLRNDGNIPLVWNITEEIGWLKAVPESGEIEGGASQEVVLYMSRPELSPGSYSGSLSISSNGGAYLLGIEAEVAAIPLLVLSDRRLDFGEDVDQHQISVRNEGNAPLEWEIRENLTGVEISPSGGQLNPGELSEVSIQLLRPDIEPGRQEILLPLYSDGGNATVVCQVTVNRAVLSVSKDTLNFRSDFWKSAQVIRNDGNIDLSWDISEDLDWLKILPARGITEANAKQSIELTADRSSLSTGSHSGVVTIESNGGVHHIQVMLEVESSFRWSISDREINLEPYDQAQVIRISNDGNIPFSWSIVGIEDWLEILPVEGALESGQEANLAIRVRQGLPPIGTFSATLVLKSNMGDSIEPIDIIVPGAVLTTAVDSVHFYANTAEVVLSLTNRGNIPLDWRAENSMDWLLLSPSSGVLQEGRSTNIHLTVDRKGMPSGLSSDMLTFISNSREGTISIPVTIAVPENARPIANAGPDQEVTVGETVQLDGSGSYDPDGDQITFEWTTSSDGISLSGRTLDRPTLILTRAGTYRISLVVNDGSQNSAFDEVVIEARDTGPIYTGNRVAIVDGRYVETISISQTSINNVGPNQSVEVAVSVTGLSGVKQYDITLEVAPAGSLDLLGTTFAHNADPFTISPGIEFPAANQLKSGAASFGAAAYGDQWLGTFTFTTLSDFSTASRAVIRVVRVSIGPTSSDREVFFEEDLDLMIQINGEAPNSTANRLPIADAGPDMMVTVGETVQLDGSGSYDPDGDRITFRWSSPSSGIIISGQALERPTVILNRAGIFQVLLFVNDGTQNSITDDVTIKVIDDGQSPSESGVATVNGRYVEAISISQTSIDNVGPNQSVEVAVSVTGLSGVKQYDVTLEVDPVEEFDLARTTFAHNADPFTISPGVEFPAARQVKSGAASFGAAAYGNQLLGTFTFTTSPSFSTNTPAEIHISRFSLGPTSTDREVFSEANLGLMVQINREGPDTSDSTAGDVQVIGEIGEDTGDAQVIGEVIEEETGDAQVIGEVIE